MDTLFCPVSQKVPSARRLARQNEASGELGSAKPDHHVNAVASCLTRRRLKVNTVVSSDAKRRRRYEKLTGRSCRFLITTRQKSPLSAQLDGPGTFIVPAPQQRGNEEPASPPAGRRDTGAPRPVYATFSSRNFDIFMQMSDVWTATKRNVRVIKLPAAESPSVEIRNTFPKRA